MECCKYLSFEMEISGETVKFYRSRKVKMYLDSENMKLFVVVPHVCDKLTDKGCSIYEKRPDSCKSFDGRKHITTKDVCLWEKE
jgi:Fe-S-cluster containining protein